MIGNHENQIISIAPPLSRCLPPFFLQSTTCRELQEINKIVNDSGKRETSDTNQARAKKNERDRIYQQRKREQARLESHTDMLAQLADVSCGYTRGISG